MQRYRPEPSWGGVTGVILGLGLAVILFARGEAEVLTLRKVLYQISLLALFAYLLYGYGTMHYRLDGNKVTVYHGGNRVFLPYATLTSVRVVDIHPKAIRRCGLGWPGCHVGRYRIEGIGVLTLYSTRLLGEIVLLDTARRRVGINPMERESFLREVTLRMNGQS